MKNIDRRKFLKKTTLSAAALSVMPSYLRANSERAFNQTYMGDFAAPKLKNLKAAFIGVGARGGYHLKFLAALPNTEVVAVCDVYEDLVKEKIGWVREVSDESRHKNIAQYYGDEDQWRKMLEEVKPDVVFIVMLENVNYSRDELMFLNMCRQGVIGEILHGEAAYIHELRWQMEEQERGTGSWRTYHYAKRNGNLYPTHGLGPVAQYMNLGRGEDTLSSLVSFSTPSRGRASYAKNKYPENHKWNQLDFQGGDLNTSILKTQLGKTIMVQWDETSPRPYTRHNLIQGTKGALAGFPTRVALEGGVDGINENHHSWVQGEDLEKLYEKYDHPLYKRLNEAAKGSGHGGMDGIMVYRIVECLQKGMPLDQNVYEGCLWSAVAPLSERSVASGGASQPFPDFTRGNWKKTQPLSIIE